MEEIKAMINKLFDDTSVDKEVSIDRMEQLAYLCQSNADSLKED